MWSYNYTNELYHYGTKGQKWGRRNFQFLNGTWTEEGKARRRKNYSDDYKDYKKLSKKNIKEMSNQELRDYNKRAQLEADYNRLKANSNSISKGAVYIAALSTALITGINLYNNVANGKRIVNEIFKRK